MTSSSGQTTRICVEGNPAETAPPLEGVFVAATYASSEGSRDRQGPHIFSKCFFRGAWASSMRASPEPDRVRPTGGKNPRGMRVCQLANGGLRKICLIRRLKCE